MLHWLEFYVWLLSRIVNFDYLYRHVDPNSLVYFWDVLKPKDFDLNTLLCLWKKLIISMSFSVLTFYTEQKPLKNNTR